MNKVIISGLVSAVIVSGGFLIQSAVADEPGGWGHFMDSKSKEAYQEGLQQKAEAAGLSVEEFKGQMKEQALEKKAELLGVSVEELQEAWDNRSVRELIEESGLEPDQLYAKKLELMNQKWQEYGLTDEEIVAKEEAMNDRYEGCQYGCAFTKGFGGKNPYHTAEGTGPCPMQVK